jgi:hypothetical protein
VKHLPGSPREMMQIETLIKSLTRSLDHLSSDIESEETRARIRDVSDPAYPSLARHLRIRHANLTRTIAALRARLEAWRTNKKPYPESLAG